MRVGTTHIAYFFIQEEKINAAKPFFDISVGDETPLKNSFSKKGLEGFEIWMKIFLFFEIVQKQKTSKRF